MQKKFLGNFLFLLFVNVLVKPAYVFGIDLKVQNVVGEEAYGLYFSLCSFAFIFFVVLDLGLTQYNSRVIAQNPSLLSKYLPNFAIAKSMLAVVFYACIVTGALILGFTAQEMYWLTMIGILLLLNSAVDYLRSNVAALHLFRIDAVFSVLNRLLLISILGGMLYSNFVERFSVEHFIQIQILAQALVALLIIAYTIRYTPKIQYSFDLNLVRQIIKEGYPYALLILLTAIYTRTDAVMLKELLLTSGASEAGYYAAAYRFLDMAVMLGVLIASQLLPMFARLLKEGTKIEIEHLAQTAFRLVMYISTTIAIGVYAYGIDIIDVLFKDYPIEYVGWIFSCLMFSFIPVASSYVYNTLMNANGSLRILNIIGIISVLTNVILNLILIPEYKALGAVYATVGTQSLAAIGHIYYAHKVLQLQFPIRLLGRIIGFTISIFCVFVCLVPIINVDWKIQLMIGAMCTIPMACIWKVLDFGMLRELRQ